MPSSPPTPPRGLKAIPWRLPIWLYRLHLGFLLGERFLLLEHIGRKTGKVRYAVLEIIGKDARPRAYYVASGFGERSHWFRNIMARPEVTIQIRQRRYRARAERLPYDEAFSRLQTYAREHPAALRELSRLLHYPYDGSEASLRELTNTLPIVRFRILREA